MVVVDAAIPLEKFDEYYQTNYLEDNMLFYEKNGYVYKKNNKSAYNNTKHNLSSFFYLDYHINENNFKSINPNNIWPFFLKKNRSNYLPFLKVLKANDYKLVHFGNMFTDCLSLNEDYCLDKDNKKIKNYYFSSYISFSFFSRSPLFSIFKRFQGLVSNENIETPEIKYIQNFYKKNDSINRFINSINDKKIEINNKGYFFLIHAMMPHGPYIFNSDCSFNKDLRNINLNDPMLKERKIFETTFNSTMYIKSYDCMLKRIKELINFINAKDSNANVVITSDHGTPLINTKEDLLKHEEITFNGYDIFSLYKLNGKVCNTSNIKNFNLVNISRKLLECNFEIKLSSAERKSYFIDCNPKVITHCEYRVKKINNLKDENEAYLFENK